MLTRQLASILLLPCTVTVLVPWWIARRAHSRLTAPEATLDMLRARFGDAYEQYTRAVRRFVPRLTPYRPEPAQA